MQSLETDESATRPAEVLYVDTYALDLRDSAKRLTDLPNGPTAYVAGGQHRRDGAVHHAFAGHKVSMLGRCPGSTPHHFTNLSVEVLCVDLVFVCAEAFWTDASDASLRTYKAFLFTTYCLLLGMPSYNPPHDRAAYVCMVINDICEELEAEDTASACQTAALGADFTDKVKQAVGCSASLSHLFSMFDMLIPMTMTFTKIMHPGEHCVCAGYVSVSEIPVLPLDDLGLDGVTTIEAAMMVTLGRPAAVGMRRCKRRPVGSSGICGALHRHDVDIAIGPTILVSASRNRPFALSQRVDFGHRMVYYLTLFVVDCDDNRFRVITRDSTPGHWISYDTNLNKITLITPHEDPGRTNDGEYICFCAFTRNDDRNTGTVHVSGASIWGHC